MGFSGSRARYRPVIDHKPMRVVLTFAVFVAAAISSFAQQKSDGGQDKHLDVQSSVGDLHVGNDADASKTGLPMYPGARLRHDGDNDNANVGLFTEAFGIKLVIVKYESDDAPVKIIDYYRESLKKFGKVLECHTREHNGDAHADFDDDDKDDDPDHPPKQLKCEGDNTGPITELKVGKENNQHVVAIEPNTGHSGAKFTLVYVHTHGKQGDI
jgi:hypothetical protein